MGREGNQRQGGQAGNGPKAVGRHRQGKGTHHGQCATTMGQRGRGNDMRGTNQEHTKGRQGHKEGGGEGGGRVVGNTKQAQVIKKFPN